MHMPTVVSATTIRKLYKATELGWVTLNPYFQVQPFNFLSMPLTLATIDNDLISLETSLASTSLTELVPNVDLIRMMMEKVFNLPRNKNTHPTNRLFRLGSRHSTEVACALHAQTSRVRLPDFPNFFRGNNNWDLSTAALLR